MADIWEGYHAVRRSVGLADRSARERLRVAGPDRAKFLHNLTTNDVKRLAVGRGQEAFVTSPQGKTLGYVTLLATEAEILLRTDPGGLASFLPHLQKYGVFDDVSLDDASASLFEYHVAGPVAEDLLHRAGLGALPAGQLEHAEGRVGASAVRVVRESPTGRTGWTLLGPAAEAGAVWSTLTERGRELGLATVGPEAFDALRIEAGTPAFGHEVTAEGLPQELGRDDRAINFVKGCYLGQETVARIDALGHVNKHLRGLQLGGSTPPPEGTPIEAQDGKRVGTVTSAGFSPGWGGVVALAYLRTSHAEPGTEVRLLQGDAATPATVRVLPMLPAD